MVTVVVPEMVFVVLPPWLSITAAPVPVLPIAKEMVADPFTVTVTVAVLPLEDRVLREGADGNRRVDVLLSGKAEKIRGAVSLLSGWDGAAGSGSCRSHTDPGVGSHVIHRRD